MICPDCGHENIQGVDDCADCGQDLTAFDAPQGRSPLESSIMKEPIEKLQPRPAVILAPDATVADAIAKLSEHHIGCVLVGSQEEILGIFSERDVLLRIGDSYEKLAASPISEFMTPDPETLGVEHPIAFALNRMSVGDFRHLPVMRDGALAGVVSIRDVLRFLGTWYPDLIPARPA
ncbi:MAG: CBS domain-containing protein [Planctomycetota bacterium]|nr:CBS domain-containing protein [Planctomycetota bacterium]